MPFRTVNSSLRTALALSHWLWYVEFYHHFLISFLFSLIISMSYLVYLYISVLTRFSCVQLFAIPWTVALQAPQSMGFFRQNLFRGMLISSPRIRVSKKLFECHWFVVQNVVYFTLILRNRKKLPLWPNICLFLCFCVPGERAHPQCLECNDLCTPLTSNMFSVLVQTSTPLLSFVCFTYH